MHKGRGSITSCLQHAAAQRWVILAAGALLATLIVALRVASAQTAPTTGDASAETSALSPTTAAVAPRSSVAPSEASPTRTFDRTNALLASLTIFVLAVFIGFEVIAKVPPTLHTPLMSGSNAVSGITIVGSLLATGHGHWFVSLVGMVAIVLAMINVVGGFWVTHRMLGMFRRK